MRTSGFTSQKLSILRCDFVFEQEKLQKPLQKQGHKQQIHWRSVSLSFVLGLNPEVPSNGIFSCNTQSK